MLYDTITELKRDRGRTRKHSTGTLQMAYDRWGQWRGDRAVKEMTLASPRVFLSPWHRVSAISAAGQNGSGMGGQGLHIPVSVGALMLRSPSFPRQTRDQPAGAEEVVPEVVGAFPLPKATAGHNTDARLLQELHAVEHVGGHLMGLWEWDRT